MTKENFYDFGVMMKNDSVMLFNNGSLHNSVYLGAFVLESYIKILLIHNNAENYFGHICNSRFVNRLNTISPESFDNSILSSNNSDYPSKLLGDDYDINYRYEVDKWTDPTFSQVVQDEVIKIYNALNNLRVTGIV